MKYTFSFEDGKIVLESRAGESDRHIALKILAYLLFRGDGDTGGLPLRIEQGVGQRHKPDLVATDPETDRVRLWIDCGQIETKRLGRIAQSNPGARIIVLKPTANEARLYAQAAARFLPERRRGAVVEYAGFEDEAFVPGFRDALRGSNTIVLRHDDGVVRVTLNATPLAARFVRFAAA